MLLLVINSGGPTGETRTLNIGLEVPWFILLAYSQKLIFLVLRFGIEPKFFDYESKVIPLYYQSIIICFD